MTKDYLDYNHFIDNAMQHVVKQALFAINEHGLYGDHHFYITFDTRHEGVMISQDLQEMYPEDMTIVVQHQFWDLEINDDDFSITLSFKNVHHNLTIPFDALIVFADPSTNFRLQFDYIIDKAVVEDVTDGVHNKSAKQQGKLKNNQKSFSKNSKQDGAKSENKDNVVTLDSFRKK